MTNTLPKLAASRDAARRTLTYFVSQKGVDPNNIPTALIAYHICDLVTGLRHVADHHNLDFDDILASSEYEHMNNRIPPPHPRHLPGKPKSKSKPN